MLLVDLPVHIGPLPGRGVPPHFPEKHQTLMLSISPFLKQMCIGTSGADEEEDSENVKKKSNAGGFSSFSSSGFNV